MKKNLSRLAALLSISILCGCQTPRQNELSAVNQANAQLAVTYPTNDASNLPQPLSSTRLPVSVSLTNSLAPIQVANPPTPPPLPIQQLAVAHKLVIVPEDVPDTNNLMLPYPVVLHWYRIPEYTNLQVEYGTNHDAYQFNAWIISTNEIGTVTIPNQIPNWYFRIRAVYNPTPQSSDQSIWSNEAIWPPPLPNAVRLWWTPTNTLASIYGATNSMQWQLLMTNVRSGIFPIEGNYQFYKTQASLQLTNRLKLIYQSPPDDLKQ